MLFSIVLLLVLRWIPIPLFAKAAVTAIVIVVYCCGMAVLIRRFCRRTWYLDRTISILLLASMLGGILNLCPYVNYSEHIIETSSVGMKTNESSSYTSLYTYSVYSAKNDGYNRAEDAEWLISEYDADFDHFSYIVSLDLEISSIRFSVWDNENIWIPFGWRNFIAEVNVGAPKEGHTIYIYKIPQMAFELRPFLSAT